MLRSAVKRGFTLVEVLVALAVLSLSAAAVVKQVAQSNALAERIDDKTQALWLAENTVANVLNTNEWPPVGRISQPAVFMGKDWLVRTEIKQTAQQRIRRIDINISPAGDSDYSVIDFSAFVGLQP